jgi:hypothetical protein
MFCASPNGKIVHNTATGGDCALVRWANWWGPNENPIIQYNSLNFNGNQSLSIQQTKDALLSKCSIDYNNYGTTFTKWPQPGARYGASVPLPFPYLPRSRELHTFTDATDPAKPATRVFYNMEDWLEFSGQDKHSTFADPKWLNPAAGRFDVKADSPNLLPDGKIIGALGYLGENPNMEPEVVVTSPYSGQTVQGDLALTADASDYDGSVRKVEFLANGQVIAEGVGGPCHKAAAVKLAPGQYAVTARAMDDRGAVGVSDAVNVIVK